MEMWTKMTAEEPVFSVWTFDPSVLLIWMLKYNCSVVAGMKATVIYSYEAGQDDELSLSVGDVIHVIAQVLYLLIYFSLPVCITFVSMICLYFFSVGRLSHSH